jgi:N-acetylmuramoyl-L-alanine amidase
MKITDHILQADNGSVVFRETPNKGKVLGAGLPDTIVIHYTAGSSGSSSANWLCNPQAKASAHLVVDKSGKVFQLAPLNVKTWHAGESQWKGRQWLNNYSIGIEIDNAGLLTKRVNGYFTHFGRKVNEDQVVLEQHQHGRSTQAWEAYTPEQLAVVEEVCSLIVETYPIKEIVGHDDIAPGRKVDPGPAYPMQQLKNKVLYSRDDETAQPVAPVVANGALVTAELLNIRSQPSATAPRVASPLARGTKLRILEDDGDWVRVNVDLEGWVSRRWVKEF